MGQLLEGMGRQDESAGCFQKGLQNRIHSAPELAATNADASLAHALEVAQAAVVAAPEDAQLCEQVATLERAAGRQAEDVYKRQSQPGPSR